MSRSFQFIGLPDEALLFLEQNKAEVIGELEFVEYFYMDGYAMCIYQTPDGTKYYESEQDCPWYAGPILFLCLQDANGNVIFKWTQDEIDAGDAPANTSAGDNKLDGDGNTIPVYQGIDQAKLVPLLTAALQEAITKIEDLEARVATLEGN